MRMLKREDCSYEDWYAMRLRVLREAPYGLLNSEYLKEERIGFLYFWDSDYIPKDWEKWVTRSVSKKTEKSDVSEEYKK